MSNKRSVLIRAPTTIIFDLLHDYGRRLDWDPFLRRADLLGEARSAGLGVRTYCAAKLRHGWLGMETEYISFQRPRVAAVRMTRGPWPLASFAASIRQRPVGSDSTEVTYKYGFETRHRWLAPLLRPLFARYFSRETGRRLLALQRYVEKHQTHSEELVTAR